jgi:hypothetical protein
MNTRSFKNDLGQSGDPRPSGISIRRRIAAGTIACIVLLSAAVLTSTPGSAAPRSKPKPTATATATPVAPSPTSSPTPTPVPTSSPTASPAPAPAPTDSPPPTAAPSPICEAMTAYGAAEYCATTLTAIATGKHVTGALVAVRGTWVLEVAGSLVVLGRDDCPADMYCGQALTTLPADFSNAQPSPTLDTLIDVYGTVAPDFSLLVDAYH